MHRGAWQRAAVCRVRFLEHGEGFLDALLIEVEDGEPHHRVHTVVLQLEHALERLLRQARLAELVVAVSEAKAHGGRRRRVDLRAPTERRHVSGARRRQAVLMAADGG
jgi:hypothetical protein